MRRLRGAGQPPPCRTSSAGQLPAHPSTAPLACLANACRYRSVSRKDYQLIEHLIRKGKRQLERLQSPEVTGVRLHHPGQ